MIDDSSHEKGIICLLKASRDEGPPGATSYPGSFFGKDPGIGWSRDIG